MKKKSGSQTGSAAPYRIDVHHHIIPSEYVKALAAVGVTSALGVRFPEWSSEKTLEMMDRMASRQRSHPSRARRPLSAMPDFHAASPVDATKSQPNWSTIIPAGSALLQPARTDDAEGALTEIEYALDTLKLDGIGLLTNYKGTYLGDSAFEAVYKDLNRRKAVVHVHPGDPPGENPFPCSASLLEAPFETTRAITNLIYGGTLEHYPDIRFIWSHGGGTIPYLATRIEEGAGGGREQPKTPRKASITI